MPKLEKKFSVYVPPHAFGFRHKSYSPIIQIYTYDEDEDEMKM